MKNEEDLDFFLNVKRPTHNRIIVLTENHSASTIPDVSTAAINEVILFSINLNTSDRIRHFGLCVEATVQGSTGRRLQIIQALQINYQFTQIDCLCHYCLNFTNFSLFASFLRL